ncbi:amidohydrolase [Corynebacterium sp. NPDC060344]|uniref:amidohydrolase n=1 Tax=Corynebacterium sp. NPDC060344 TaxID=3347101 RepID=UPI003662242B
MTDDGFGARLRAWRRDIHAHPELSYGEERTTGVVVKHLESLGLAPRRLPGTGVICDVGADATGGGRIALRADLDALALDEQTGLDFASANPGVMHACGHDAHTAMLMGAAELLAAADREGRCPPARLVFQAAEETVPGGALDAIGGGALDGVARIFALHVDPTLPVGELGVVDGPITSSNAMVTVNLRGAGGHTARPHRTADLGFALGQVLTTLPAVLDRRLDPKSATVLTWGRIEAGEAPNSIPASGSARGTLRSADVEVWAMAEDLVRESLAGILAPWRVEWDLDYVQGVPPVVNDAECTAALVAAAEGIADVVPTHQSSGGEDFAWYQRTVPGAMARLGVSGPGAAGGGTADLHRPDFDLDEAALPIGARVLAGAVLGS